MADYLAYLQRNGLASTGYIPNTPASIKAFQRVHGLVADGIVGPKTRKALRLARTDLGDHRRGAASYGGRT
jgi:peptidoglycan hydrolase-like protein with peptidoglycan-binding domain